MEKFIKEFSDFLADYRIDVYDAKETGTNSANFSESGILININPFYSH